MSTVYCQINENDFKLTDEQIRRLQALKDKPITYDEDCPELTDEELAQFKRVSPRKKTAND